MAKTHNNGTQYRPPPEPWFAIRKPLRPGRRLLLTIASFLLPLGLWCLVSYVPAIWHPDIKLEVSATRQGSSTVFNAGDRVSPDFFPGFVAAIVQENETVRALRENPELAGDMPMGFRARRANVQILREIHPLARNNGFLTRDQAEDDDAIYDVWRQIAIGELKPRRPALTEENLAVVSRNWAVLEAETGATFNARDLPEFPLEKLVPQGVRSNPVYLPAPHAVLQRGYEDFTREPAPGRPSMFDRYQHSLRIVFSGFLIAAAIGVPLGILCGTFDFFSRLFEPFVDFFRYMPAPAFSTLLVAIFLAHDAPKIALVFIGTFFQMVLVVANTTRQLDTSLLEAAQTLGAKRLTLIRRVILPGITPNLFNDLRILLGWAWTWLVIAELIGVKSGLTEFIETQGRWRNFDRVFPVIILIGITGFTTDQILASLRKYLFPWTPEQAGRKHGIIKRFFIWLLENRESPYTNGKASS